MFSLFSESFAGLNATLLVIGFVWLNVLALLITSSKKYDVKEKLEAIGTPGSILILALTIGIVGYRR